MYVKLPIINLVQLRRDKKYVAGSKSSLAQSDSKRYTHTSTESDSLMVYYMISVYTCVDSR